jgi:hypothetical protein
MEILMQSIKPNAYSRGKNLFMSGDRSQKAEKV